MCLDEFQSLTTLALANMLYRVNLVLANECLSNVDFRCAMRSYNAGTLVSFRVGGADPEILAREFFPEFTPADLVSLPNYNIYLKLTVDGVVSRGRNGYFTPPWRGRRFI